MGHTEGRGAYPHTARGGLWDVSEHTPITQPSNTNDTPTPTLPPRHRRNPPEQRSKHGARRPMTYTLQQERTLLQRSTAVSGVPLRRATAACNCGLSTQNSSKSR